MDITIEIFGQIGLGLVDSVRFRVAIHWTLWHRGGTLYVWSKMPTGYVTALL